MPDNLDDNQWILKLPSELFTVQIMSGGNAALLRKVVPTLPVVDTHMIYRYKQRSDEVPVFALAIGLFNSREDAALFSESLPAEVIRNKPWIRQIAAIQRVIDG